MRRALMLSALMLAAPPATAQYFGWSTITPSIAGTDTLGLALRRNAERVSPIPRSTAPAQGRTATPAVDPAKLTFQSSPARRRANLDAFIRKARERNAAAGADVARAIGQGDVIGQLEPILHRVGLRADNVADAVALYWIVAWQTSKGHNDDFSRAKATAVRQQVTAALVKMPSIAGADDAAKQEFAETLLIQSILFDSAVTAAKGDAKMLAMLGSVARQGASGMGINLSAMTLTERGFVPV